MPSVGPATIPSLCQWTSYSSSDLHHSLCQWTWRHTTQPSCKCHLDLSCILSREDAFTQLFNGRVNHAPLTCPKGKHRSSCRGYCDPNGVHPKQRISEFSGEELTVSAGKLFCRACCECVWLKHSIIFNHIKSTKHAEGKKRLLQKEATEVDIAVTLKQHDADTHHKGETLPEEQVGIRYKLQRHFCKQECLYLN